MTNLETHADMELRRAGLFSKDSDYEGMIGDAVMKLVRVFAAEGHSGTSGRITLDIFNRVCRFQTLTPITSEPNEWMDVDDPDRKLWQNRRQSSCFSNDGGKTYYDISSKDPTAIKTSETPR
jgi:hypothetical protein